jgi:serine/threonine protein kinase
VKEKIGKYQLQEQIGVGGFGEVFRAFDPLIKRHVALKTCSSGSEEIRSRFFQEAEIAGNLQHRNITTVYDFGLEDGLPYLVQEYLSGEDLDRKIKRREPVNFGTKLGWMLQVARGLAAAHAAGVIHRDVKPSNIRILDDGTAKIMDFGIAKLIQQESGLTQTGMTIGTAAYLSPEQVRGDAVDARTDVFSFGVLSYELLTYSRPFEGREISAVLYHVLHTEPKPVSEVWPGAPSGVVTIVRRCLEKSASKRFGDGGDLARELERLNSQIGTVKNLDNAAMTVQLETTPVQGLPSSRVGRLTIPPPPPPREPAPPFSPAVPHSPSTTRTPAMVAPPPIPPPGAPPSARSMQLDPPPARRRSGLDAVELAAGAPAPRDSSTASHSSLERYRHLQRPLGIGAALVALVLVGALVGWLVGSRRSDPPPATGTTVTAPKVEPPKPEPPKPEPPKPEPPKAEPKAPAPVAAPPPQDARLAIAAAGWTDGMTVTLGRRAFKLDRDQQLSLKPGTYNLVFELQEEGYQASAPLRITLGEGESRRIEPPLAQPGMLSVRPLPRRPAGDIYLDGQALGPANLSRRRLSPGSHQLEIRGKGGAPGRVQKTLQIEPGRETVVSFDLEKGDAQIVVK